MIGDEDAKPAIEISKVLRLSPAGFVSLTVIVLPFFFS
jgi:hypothetical protein